MTIKECLQSEANFPADPESVHRYTKYFTYFLNELEIDEMCFKTPKGQWAFDENGKALFLTLLKSIKPKPKMAKRKIYSNIRNGIFSKDHLQEYDWILLCICSNLKSLSERFHSEKLVHYPSEAETRSAFWENILDKTGYDISILPGLSSLLEIISGDEFRELIKISTLQDIIYIDHMIQTEFEDIYARHIAAYETDCEKSAKKWWQYISLMASHRLTERKQAITEVDASPSNAEKVFSIANELSFEPFYTQGKDFKHAEARKKERLQHKSALSRKIMELRPQLDLLPIHLAPQLTSQELFEIIKREEIPPLDGSIE